MTLESRRALTETVLATVILLLLTFALTGCIGPRAQKAILLAPAYAIAQATTHEFAHATAATLTGRRVLSFTPYPHTMQTGEFVLASTQFESPSNPLIDGAPFISASTLFVTADIASRYTTSPDTRLAWQGVMLVSWLDLARGMLTGGSDAHYLSESTRIDENALRAVGVTLLLLGAWELWRSVSAAPQEST